MNKRSGSFMNNKMPGATSDFTLEERWMLKYSQPAKIKVVGVWDTVGSLGIPAFSIEGISRPTFGYLHTGLRIHIENAYHALAFRNDVDIDGDVNTAPINDSYKEFAYGLYSKVVNPLFRKIGEDPEIRDDGTHTNVNQTIDGSVFERWR